MKAAIKFIMTAVGLLLIGLLLTVILLFTRFEGALQSGLTHQAGKILKCEVHLEGIRVDWTARSVVFKGLSLFNPEGFTDREAIRVGTMTVKVEPLTLFSKSPVLQQITLNDMRMHLQYTGENKSNLGALLTQARDYATSQDSGEVAIWGRRLKFNTIHLGASALATEGIEPAVAVATLETLPLTTENPNPDEVLTVARTFERILMDVVRQVQQTAGVSDALRIMLEPTPVPVAVPVPAPASASVPAPEGSA